MKCCVLRCSDRQADTIVSSNRDSGTWSSLMAELWILNKSMPSGWTPGPLLNDSHRSQIATRSLCLHFALSVYFSPNTLSLLLTLLLLSAALIPHTFCSLRTSCTRTHGSDQGFFLNIFAFSLFFLRRSSGWNHPFPSVSVGAGETVTVRLYYREIESEVKEIGCLLCCFTIAQ